MALMASEGAFSPMPNCAIYADTHWEPPTLYPHMFAEVVEIDHDLRGRLSSPAIRNHGEDAIKDEVPPLVAEYPCFVLSMNQELKAFTDQIVKRSLMIYTTTALPSYKESLRHDLHIKVQGGAPGPVHQPLTGIPEEGAGPTG